MNIIPAEASDHCIGCHKVAHAQIDINGIIFALCEYCITAFIYKVWSV
jgi:hypothetical protein